MNNFDNNQPMWAFLSHSSADISRVKQIRNECEGCGMDALMFNLRGLAHGTEDEKKELISIIHREIEARDWFILCKSQNTGGPQHGTWKSKWVEDEWNYADKIGKRNKILLDIDADDINLISEKVRKLNRLHNIFISHMRADVGLAHVLRMTLMSQGFNVSMGIEDVFIEDGFAFSWLDTITTQTKNCDLGIVLLTEKTIRSGAVDSEIHSLLFNGKTILPIFVCRSKKIFDTSLIPPLLFHYQWLVTTEDSLADVAQTELIAIINRLI